MFDCCQQEQLPCAQPDSMMTNITRLMMMHNR